MPQVSSYGVFCFCCLVFGGFCLDWFWGGVGLFGLVFGLGLFLRKIKTRILSAYEKAHLAQAKYTTGLHHFKIHAVLPSTPLAGVRLSTITVPMLFLAGLSSNNVHTTE